MICHLFLRTKTKFDIFIVIKNLFKYFKTIDDKKCEKVILIDTKS